MRFSCPVSCYTHRTITNECLVISQCRAIALLHNLIKVLHITRRMVGSGNEKLSNYQTTENLAATTTLTLMLRCMSGKDYKKFNYHP